MVKKLISLLGVVGVLSTLIVPAAFAEDGVLTLSANTLTYVQAGTQKVTVSFTKPQGATVTTLEVRDGSAVIKNLNDPTCAADATSCSVDWDGLVTGIEVPVKTGYSVVLALSTGETDTKPLTIGKDLWVKTFNTADLTWDPATGDLSLAYELSKQSSVTFDFIDGAEIVKTISAGSVDSGTMVWNGTVSDDLVVPKTYVLELSAVATVNGQSKTVTTTKNLTVKYEDAATPKLAITKPINADEKAFTAEEQEVTITFDLDGTAYITVEIVDADGAVVYTPSDFDGTDEYSDETLSLDWDGTKGIGDVVNSGNYTVSIVARNDLGVAVNDSVVLAVTSAGSKYKAGGSKIKNIDLDPSGDWDPLEENLGIEWELTTDFDTVKIEARKGGQVVEIYEEDDLSDKTYDTDFDGKDEDDEYLEPGEWTLLFLGDIDETTYYVEHDFTVKYESPEIDEVFVTKKEIDPEIGEGVYFGFMLQTDAKVSVVVLKNGSSKVDLLGEDDKEEVEKDKWYAVYWDGLDDDGDDFDYDDTFKIQLEACSVGSEDDCETQSVTVDLDEDDVSSSKSNITMDMLVPPVIEEGGDVELTFNIEDDAETKVAIWEGASASGTADVVLMDYTPVPDGDYKFVWDTRDEDGDVMDDGYYSYKIYTQKDGSSSTDTETGKFVIGKVGDVYGGPSETGSSDTDDGSSSLLDNPYLVLTGGDDSDTDSDTGSDTDGDYSFVDVVSSNPNYAAIQWVAEEGIFEGDPSGEFRPYDGINRAEVLAVAMRAFNLSLYPDDGTTLGWNDVIPGAWYMKYLRSGKLYGLLSGDGLSNTVRPSDAVQRVEFLKFLYEGAKLSGVTVVPACSYNPYADVSVGNWYTGYVCQSKMDNLFKVVGDLFLPAVQASRAEVAEAIYRLLGN